MTFKIGAKIIIKYKNINFVIKFFSDIYKVDNNCHESSVLEFPKNFVLRNSVEKPQSWSGIWEKDSIIKV